MIRTENEQDVAVIHLLSDIDMQEVVSIRNTVVHLLEEGCAQLVLDLSRVQHINATGIGILTDSLRQARHRHGDLRLSSMHPKIKNVFELTGMDKVFHIYSDQPAAIRSFKAYSQAA